jgi:hypothetical protein
MYTCEKQGVVSVALTTPNLLHIRWAPSALDHKPHYTMLPGRLNSAWHPIVLDMRNRTAP